jgi:hypothetical protein
MQIPLDPHLLDTTPVIISLEAVAVKKLPKVLLNDFIIKYRQLMEPYFEEDIINQLFKEQAPLYLSYKTSPEEYIYWLTLKLSILKREYVQTTLNYALNTYPDSDIHKRIENDILVTLEKNWKWTTKSNIKEIKIWLEITVPAHNSIFTPAFSELIYLELQPRLIDQTKKDVLNQLIYSNITPTTSLTLNYYSIQDLCILFSLVKRKKQTKLSYSQLALWIAKSFNALNKEGLTTQGKPSSIERYLDSKHDTPDRLKNWL